MNLLSNNENVIRPMSTFSQSSFIIAYLQKVKLNLFPHQCEVSLNPPPPPPPSIDIVNEIIKPCPRPVIQSPFFGKCVLFSSCPHTLIRPSQVPGPLLGLAGIPRRIIRHLCSSNLGAAFSGIETASALHSLSATACTRGLYSQKHQSMTRY